MSKRQIVRSNSDTRFFNNKEVFETSNYNLTLLKKDIEFDFKLNFPTQSNKESKDAQEGIISY